MLDCDGSEIEDNEDENEIEDSDNDEDIMTDKEVNIEPKPKDVVSLANLCDDPDLNR